MARRRLGTLQAVPSRALRADDELLHLAAPVLAVLARQGCLTGVPNVMGAEA
jgi:hypothetical protein